MDSRPSVAAFATTCWTAVLAAGGDSSPTGRAALDRLCQAYWPPVYAYARRAGHGPEDARDLTQGFFSHLLETGALARADPQRGRFRSFLLGAFKHFLAHERDRAKARKRGGDLIHHEAIKDAKGSQWENVFVSFRSSWWRNRANKHHSRDSLVPTGCCELARNPTQGV